MNAQIEDFYNTQFGAATTPETIALKAIVTEIISKWEVFRDVAPAPAEPYFYSPNYPKSKYRRFLLAESERPYWEEGLVAVLCPKNDDNVTWVNFINGQYIFKEGAVTLLTILSGVVKSGDFIEG